MKSKIPIAGLFVFFLSLLSSCQPDYESILFNTFEDHIIKDKVSRIVIIPDKSYVEVYMKTEAGGEVFVIRNQVKEYFIDRYQRLLEEESIANPPGLEFDTRVTFDDLMAYYAWPLIFILFTAFMLIVISRQRSTIHELRERVRELEDEVKYTK